MPVRRRTRQPRDLHPQPHPDVPEPTLGHELLDPHPPRRRRARTTRVLIDDRHALARPAQLDGALAQRILARRRLRVALHLPERRLTHIHHRAPATMRIGDLRAVTHRAPPPPTGPAAAPAAASPRAALGATAPPTPPPPPPSARRSPTPAAPTSPPPFRTEAAPRRGRRARS